MFWSSESEVASRFRGSERIVRRLGGRSRLGQTSHSFIELAAVVGEHAEGVERSRQFGRQPNALFERKRALANRFRVVEPALPPGNQAERRQRSRDDCRVAARGRAFVRRAGTIVRAAEILRVAGSAAVARPASATTPACLVVSCGGVRSRAIARFDGEHRQRGADDECATHATYGAILKAAVRLCVLEPSPCSTSTRQKPRAPGARGSVTGGATEVSDKSALHTGVPAESVTTT